ncbi:unnamed protein product [Sphagnum jensenii]|uniref:Transmembrane protein n=1 Tax=Sphagnum jensenii TaxID=128206 RepID=A0ABP1BGC0_9BRYO
MKILRSLWLDVVVIVFVLLYCIFSFPNCLICAVRRPLVTSQTTGPISMTEAKGDGSGWEESRDSSAKPVGIFGAETTCTAPLGDAEANTCMAESCSIEHQLLCSGPSQQCVHRTPERTSSVALEDVIAGNNLLTMICKDSDQVCHPDAAVANFQVKKEQIHRDAEPKLMFLDTMKPMEICSRQQIVRSWCTCWGLTQMLVGVGFILFPYVRKSELNDFAHNRLSASSPEYLQWVLQSRSR